MDVPRRMTSRPRLRRVALVGGVLAAVAAVTLYLQFLRDRPPSIDREALWIGTVERGRLELNARGGGSLVPEEVRWTAAPMAARVERVMVRGLTPEGRLVVETESSKLKAESGNQEGIGGKRIFLAAASDMDLVWPVG